MSKKQESADNTMAASQEQTSSEEATMKKEEQATHDYEKYADDFPIQRSGVVIVGWTK